MPNTADEQRFDAIRARYRAAVEREEEYRQDVLFTRYRKFRPARSWMTNAEINRLEVIRRAQDREGEKMFTLLDRIGGRDWRSGVPYVWVMDELTFADATTDAELSIVPPPGYGSTDRDMRSLASPRNL